MKKATATRLAEAMEAMASERTVWLRFGVRQVFYTAGRARAERDNLLKASVELRRLAAKPKKKQSKVGHEFLRRGKL